MQRKKVTVLTDPYSTGRKLALKLKEAGHTLVRVSGKKIPDCFQDQHNKQTDQFEKTIIFENLEQVKKELTDFEISHCIAGAECGVLEAAEIASDLNLPTANDIKFKKAWRNKFELGEALHAAGLRSVPHIKSSQLDEVMAWAEKNGFKENETPIVLKPLEGAGTNDVFICHTKQNIEDAFNKIMSSETVFHKKNHEVIAQQYIKGHEYAVNAVARDSEIFVTDITRYGKKIINGSPVYDTETYLCPVKDKEIFDKLSDYLKKSAQATGINHGPIHYEVKIQDGDCIGIDLGLRLPGDIDLVAIEKIMGYTQASVLMEALYEPEKFKQRVRAPREANKHALQHVFLISDQAGNVIKDSQKAFEHIPGYFAGNVDLAIGSKIEVTKDMLTLPGWLVFMGKNEESLKASYNAVRAIEKNLYYSCTHTLLQQIGDVAVSAVKHPYFPYVAGSLAAVGAAAVFGNRVVSDVTKDNVAKLVPKLK